MKNANSALYPLITRYLELKVALGRNYITERWILLSLDRFLSESQAEDLTIELFTHWCQRQNHLTSGVLRNRMRIVRNFCLYRQRTQYNCFVPDINLFPTSHQPIQPYIFTDAEIGRLLQAAQTIKAVPRSPLRPEVFRLAVVLLYTTGLRRGELVRLTIADYDPRDQTLRVRASKFHKSRILPLAADVAGEIHRYFEARRHLHLPMSPDRPLVWSGYGHGYTGSGIWQGIRLLLRIADIRTSDGRLPRIHDMRHSFAANVLLRWYRKGVDVQAKLPLLSTYMGHVSIASTEYYLHFSEPLATESSIRFEACCGDLITPIVLSQGGAR